MSTSTYQPWVMRRFMPPENRRGVKDTYQARLRAKIRTAEAIEQDVQGSVAPSHARVAHAMLDEIQREAGTVAEAEAALDARLATVHPALPVRVKNTAGYLERTGAATSSRGAVAQAVAEEISKLARETHTGRNLQPACAPGVREPGLGSVAMFFGPIMGSERYARMSSNAPPWLRTLLKADADWHCSTASTAVGSAIMGAFLGPAAAAAGAEGATALQGVARCDLWQLSRALERQIKDEGGSATTEQAMALLENQTYFYDAKTNHFYKTATLEGYWVRYGRPVAPFAAAGVGLWILLKAAKG